MCMLDKIRAKRDGIYAIVRRRKAEKLWVFGSCARKEERLDCDVRRCGMIVRDGKCYAENPLPVLKITGFETFAPHQMRVVFNDGETRIFDGRTLLKGEAFAPLADADTFADCRLDYETLTWLDGELDVAPEFVYENSMTCH